MKETKQNYTYWLREVEQNAFSLANVPDELITSELCELAVNRDGRALGMFLIS
jgi:hypothetical protein